ncbi:DUF418 domain-containing protein [Aquamicrobium sp. LC103]|uniref:DUF418 domain-containing protein n=1 Tax=Aquamicrobium sp. LC103 TaxID=1120658 RepID=UPI00063EAAF6|nr:DUF418 domain-containing protein [Aquamicrobium sp. LC103]TKT80343.1 DUF418 domain-containing protein [Aquamicrobium sp. LC103]
MEIPVSEKERIVDVDALRGLALFGILVVNVTAFASAYYASGAVDPAFDRAQDRLVLFATELFFATKFYLLFSFLFGYSFTLQMQSAERSGEAFVPRLLRRQAGLWVIGLAHAVLLFHGDILTTYAVLGVVLLMLRRQSERRMLRLAFWLIAGTVILWAAIGLLAAIDPDQEAVIAEAAANAQAAMLAYRGTPASVIAQHLRELSWVWVVLGLMQAPCALAMFLIGFVAGRREIFTRAEAHVGLFRRLLRVGLAVGLPGAFVFAFCSIYLEATGWEILGLVVGLATAPFLAGAYAAGAMLAFQSPAGHRVARALAPAGRMALSNYLLQSLVCAFVFLAYGLRMMGEISPLAAAAFAAALFLAQLLFSRWWMGNFAYGPIEWLLRAVTIAGRPRWRRKPA